MARLAVIAYVPALHNGYLSFFKKYEKTELYLIGPEFFTVFRHLERDLRAVSAEEMRTAISALDIFFSVQVLTIASLRIMAAEPYVFVMPDEDVSHTIARSYLPKHSDVVFESTFLRWDMKNTTSEKEVAPDRIISEKAFDIEMMGHAFAEAQKSPDWWRRVGALAVKEGKILLSAFNKHMPHEQSLYVLGDPRGNFSWGEKIELSNALHAEQSIIAQAAKLGIRTEDASLYVTTFPCPRCAVEVATASFARVYYSEGYSLTGADGILREHNIEIVRVKVNPASIEAG